MYTFLYTFCTQGLFNLYGSNSLGIFYRRSRNFFCESLDVGWAKKKSAGMSIDMPAVLEYE